MCQLQENSIGIDLYFRLPTADRDRDESIAFEIVPIGIGILKDLKCLEITSRVFLFEGIEDGLDFGCNQAIIIHRYYPEVIFSSTVDICIYFLIIGIPLAERIIKSEDRFGTGVIW